MKIHSFDPRLVYVWEHSCTLRCTMLSVRYIAATHPSILLLIFSWRLQNHPHLSVYCHTLMHWYSSSGSGSSSGTGSGSGSGSSIDVPTESPTESPTGQPSMQPSAPPPQPTDNCANAQFQSVGANKIGKNSFKIKVWQRQTVQQCKAKCQADGRCKMMSWKGSKVCNLYSSTATQWGKGWSSYKKKC